MFGSNKRPKQPLDVDAQKNKEGQSDITLDNWLQEYKASIATLDANYEKELAAARLRIAASNKGSTANTSTQEQGANSVPATKKSPTIK